MDRRKRANAKFRRKIRDIDTQQLASKAAELVRQRLDNDGVLPASKTRQIEMIKRELESRGYRFPVVDLLNAVADAIDPESTPRGE